MPPVFVQRVAGPDGVLAPAFRALKFGAGLTVTPHPGESLAGAQGGDGQVTDYLEIAADNDAPITRDLVASVTTIDGTTHVPAFTFNVLAGGAVGLESTFYGKATAGGGSGNVIKMRLSAFFYDVSGTATVVNVTVPTSGHFELADGTGAVLGFANIGISISGLAVTVYLVGVGGSTIKWAPVPIIDRITF